MTPLQIAENLSAAGLDHPAVDDAVIKLTNWAGGGASFRALAERAVPFLRDEAEKYEDDGSNEPLELAREIESLLASSPSDESALSSASLAFDVGAEAAHPSRGVVDEDVVARAVAAMNAVRSWNPDVKDDYVRKLARAALQAAALPAVPELLSADDVQWIVNDSSELGVMIRGQCFFLYKGDSLVYEDAKHDDGSPMFIRTVGKREFGECCHPIGDDISACGYQHRWGKVSLGDSDRWQPMPAATPAHDQPEGGAS